MRVILRVYEFRRSLRADDSLQFHGIEFRVKRHYCARRTGRVARRQQIDEVHIELFIRRQRVEHEMNWSSNRISFEEVESFRQ